MFGIEIYDAGLFPSMLVALFAGLVSFISPCVLPIVPPYLAYMSGVNLKDMAQGDNARRRAVKAALCFVLGLSTVFILLGIAASSLGVLFLEYKTLLGQIAGAVVILFGLHFLGVIRIGFLDQDLRLETGEQGGTAFGAYVLGLAFAFGWTPCMGPQLGAILALSASEGSVAQGTILLAVYAIGLGVPFVLAAMFISRAMDVMNKFKRHMKTIERVMGVFLIFIGLVLMFDRLSSFSFWLLEAFPILQSIG